MKQTWNCLTRKGPKEEQKQYWEGGGELIIVAREMKQNENQYFGLYTQIYTNQIQGKLIKI